MTSDAKVGLLLGLVFIFVIAFIINGLPKWTGSDTEENNELTTALIRQTHLSPGYGANERKLITQEIRYRTSLPQNQPPRTRTQPVIRETVPLANTQPLSTRPAPTKVEITKAPVVLETKPYARITPPKTEPSALLRKTTLKIYTVQKGDNLAKIAKKFYGPEEGNRRVNIDRIFKANSSKLDSPNSIRVGDKIAIPPLAPETPVTNNTLQSSMFTQTESVGQRHVREPVENTDPATRFYKVKKGDSLWKIAEKQLNNGKRYLEIAKLNSDVLSDGNSVRPGMKLKLPAR